MAFSRISLIVAACAAAYLGMFWLNQLVFSSSGFSEGVDWIFLPSGVRLACVLVFLHWGALGVALATTAISWHLQVDGNFLTAAVTGAISGFAPWVAHSLYLRMTGIGRDLAQLSSATLLGMAALFAVITASFHQVWYWVRGMSQDVLQSLAVMALGDFVGSLVVLYLLKLGLVALMQWRPSR